jgi:hypothetical protein
LTAPTRLIAAAVAGLILSSACAPDQSRASGAVLAATGSPAAGQPAVAASPSAADPAPTSTDSAASPATFTSTFYAYSISVPGGWSVRPALARWDGSGAPDSANAAIDLFVSPRSAEAFVSAAPTNEALAAYVAEGIATNTRVRGRTCPARPESVERVSVGGDEGTLVSWNCHLLFDAAFVVHNGIGYRFVFRDPRVEAATDAGDRKVFEAMLASVVFR